ncbi:MAG TPA: hypothetical protein VF043_33125 [Ktedonobacteraceae bacterium]
MPISSCVIAPLFIGHDHETQHFFTGQNSSVLWFLWFASIFSVNVGERPVDDNSFDCNPHARFIAMLTYKAELVGITVKVTEESYTSKASLLDLDPLPVRDQNNGNEKHTFSGKRVKRGLYRASDGRKLNADINGAGNIIRKVAPDAFGLRVVEDGKAVLASLVVHPDCRSPHEAKEQAFGNESKRSIERSISLQNAMFFGTRALALTHVLHRTILPP